MIGYIAFTLIALANFAAGNTNTGSCMLAFAGVWIASTPVGTRRKS